ncbi:lactonase family protein [Arcticibacter sp. MXS-1]|uniref:lactonase family protein n=1 Tax=Arcticibacter sp. MXS-1 TaxID=3341726 RepID=UPI0035A87B31
MNKYHYLAVTIILSVGSVFMNVAEAQKLDLVIGTYTNKGTSEGIYVYEFDCQSGKSTYKNKVTGVSDPSYLAISKDSKFLYAVNEGEAAVSAFSFDKQSGAITFLNKKPSKGGAPCYIVTDQSQRHVIVGNYSGGNLSVFPIKEDGSIGDAIQTIQHKGSGVDKERQEGPHVHSTVFSPDQKYVFVSDLGTDQISSYKFNPSSAAQPLSPASPAYTEVPKGSGPRHLDFHPSGKFAYSIQEMSGNVSVFQYQQGQLKLIQNISMLDPGFKGKTGAADVHVSPDGKFLYTSNRGDANDIAVFSINPSNGKLSLKGRSSTLGKGPRNFAIDPTGNYLLAGNHNSDYIVVFKRNKTTGLLADTGERIKVGAPVCLKFVR